MTCGTPSVDDGGAISWAARSARYRAPAPGVVGSVPFGATPHRAAGSARRVRTVPKARSVRRPGPAARCRPLARRSAATRSLSSTCPRHLSEPQLGGLQPIRNTTRSCAASTRSGQRPCPPTACGNMNWPRYGRGPGGASLAPDENSRPGITAHWANVDPGQVASTIPRRPSAHHTFRRRFCRMFHLLHGHTTPLCSADCYDDCEAAHQRKTRSCTGRLRPAGIIVSCPPVFRLP